jgi:hypothetical protein
MRNSRKANHSPGAIRRCSRRAGYAVNAGRSAAARVRVVGPRCAMTMIEVHVNEDHSELERLVRNAYSSIGYPQTLPSFRFGPVIIWQGRMFQQVEISIECEDLIFRLWNLPANRTRVQTGSMRGEVFMTPPEAECEPAARSREGGRCGREYLVRPFYCSDYDHDA